MSEPDVHRNGHDAEESRRRRVGPARRGEGEDHDRVGPLNNAAVEDLLRLLEGPAPRPETTRAILKTARQQRPL